MKAVLWWSLRELPRTHCLLHALRETFGKCALRNVVLGRGEFLDRSSQGEWLAQITGFRVGSAHRFREAIVCRVIGSHVDGDGEAAHGSDRF